MSLHDASNSESRVNCIFDGIINVATSSDSRSSSNAVNNAIVFACLTDLAADSLGLAVLGESCGGGEVTEAVDTLKFLVTVSGGLQVLNER
jgi:hypothetical protein